MSSSLLKAAKHELDQAEIEVRALTANGLAPAGLMTLQRLIQSAMIEAHKRMMLATFPTFKTDLDPRFRDVSADMKLQQRSNKTLNEVITAFEKAPSRNKPGSKTKLKHKAQFRIMREFFGAYTPVADITREDTRAFRSLMQTLPKNAQKHDPKLDVKKAVQAGKRDGRKPMSPGTANDYPSISNPALQLPIC
nr:hypothetical protein [uncultured Cohaesibacter sp.]